VCGLLVWRLVVRAFFLFLSLSLSFSVYLSLYLFLSPSTSLSWTGFFYSFSQLNPSPQVRAHCFVLPWSYSRSILYSRCAPCLTPVLIMFRAFGTSPAETPPSGMDFCHPWGIGFFSSKGEFCVDRDTVTDRVFTVYRNDLPFHSETYYRKTCSRNFSVSHLVVPSYNYYVN